MMWLPSIIRILIRNEQQRGVHLWLPVIILWPLLLALGIALAPVAFNNSILLLTPTILTLHPFAPTNRP